MNKKTISLLRLAVCMALVMTLFICAAAPSLADYGTINDDGALVGTEQNPADAAITKIFSKGQDTPTPNATFTFKFEKVSIDGNPNLIGSMPAIPDASVSFTANDTVDSSMLAWNAGQTDYMPKETQPIFSNINWQRAGIYLYRVYEAEQGVTITDNQREKVTYSKAQYEITVYVAEKTDGGFYVWAIGAKRIRNDAGSTSGQDVGFKVDPRPGGDPDDEDDSNKYSKITFRNDYLWRGNGKHDETVLKVSKTTTGLGSDSQLYFNFNITIQKPVYSEKTVYKVYVYEIPLNGGTPQKLSYQEIQNNASSYAKNDGYLELPIGQSVSFKLKHNQYLSFADMDAGATYLVTELATTDYTPSYQLTVNGVQRSSEDGTQGAQLAMASEETVNKGTNNDAAAFTNRYKTIIPTGIAVDDLPYFAIFAVAAIALGGYLFFKVRNRKEDEAAVETN